MAGTIDKNSLEQEIFNNREVKALIKETVQIQLNQQKQKFIKEFQNHPVTQELQAGENATNISNTLGGYGNLFTFIGFDSTANPVQNVLNLLESTGKVIKVSYKKNSFIVSIDLASKSDFENITKMPWEAGRSWLFDIEKTISGLGAYLYGRFAASRSGGGIQSRVNYSNRRFQRVNYFNTMYNKFIQKIK